MIHLVWQLPLIWVAISQLGEVSQWPEAWQTLLLMSPYVIAAFGVFIAIWLNRAQPIMVLLTLAGLNWVLYYFLGADRESLSAHILYPLVALLLPISLFLWLLIPEKGVQNKPYLIMAFSLLGAQAFTIYWALDNLPINLISHISAPVQNLSLPIQIPIVALAVSALVILFMILRNVMCQRLKVLDNTLIWVLLLLLIGLNDFQSYGVMAWVSSIAGLMILLAIIFDAHQLAYTDELTGLKGRRALFESFMGLGRHYSIAMMDIDHFKKFNDTYGHDVGDIVLQAVAEELAQVKHGQVFRYGGEEFAVVFKGKTAEEAKDHLEVVREAIAQAGLKVKHKGKMTAVKVTVSFGVAMRHKHSKKATQVLKVADEALYKAKQAGRNCIILAGEKPAKAPVKKEEKKKA